MTPLTPPNSLLATPSLLKHLEYILQAHHFGADIDISSCNHLEPPAHMHTSQKRLRQQQKHLAHHAQKNNAYTFFSILNAAHYANDLDVLLMLITQPRVCNRLGGIEPRNMKGRPKAYPFLMKPRAEARAL